MKKTLTPAIRASISPGFAGAKSVASPLPGAGRAIAPAIALPAPGNGLATDLAPANPGEMLARIAGVRVFFIAHEKLVRILIASVITLALHELRFRALRADIPVAVFQLPDRGMFDIVSFRVNGPACFKNQRVEALFRKFFCCPAAGDSRSNDNRIISRCRHLFSAIRLHLSRRAPDCTHVARRE